MSAYFPRNALLPGTAFDRLSAGVPPRREAGLVAQLAGFVAVARERAQARRELYAMSDMELRDIGLTRGEIEQVLDPGFARGAATRR
ncbi:MAG: DUF1127 domain-containing protein [Rhodospirillales bacterium]|jgi:uncharacterized protein YjiS (DUF1127 family)|nr:DUF1127 domain-containing protein [Rhodospirillales bacterium]